MEDISIREILRKNLPESVKIDKALLEDVTELLLRVLFCLDDATTFPRFFVQKGFFQLARDVKPLKFAFLSNGYLLKNCNA